MFVIGLSIFTFAGGLVTGAESVVLPSAYTTELECESEKWRISSYFSKAKSEGDELIIDCIELTPEIKRETT